MGVQVKKEHEAAIEIWKNETQANPSEEPTACQKYIQSLYFYVCFCYDLHSSFHFPLTLEQYMTLLHGSSSFLLLFFPIFTLLLCAMCFTCAFHFLFVSPKAWITHDLHAFTSCLYSFALYINK